MVTTLVISLFLAIHSHAGSIARSSSAASISTSSTTALDNRVADADADADADAEADADADATTSSSLLDVDEELTKIADVCFTRADYEQLAGNVVRSNFARMLSFVLVYESVASIGLAELRSALHFAPLPPWKPHNDTEPSENELGTAPTPEAYYDLKEPRSHRRSLDSEYLFEKNVTSGIAFLDARLPSIRALFRQTFKEKREGAIDRKAIEYWISEYWTILDRVDHATSKMLSFKRKCRKFE